MTNADYTDDLAHLTKSPAQAESLLNGLVQAVGGINLYVNTNRIKFMHFK